MELIYTWIKQWGDSGKSQTNGLTLREKTGVLRAPWSARRSNQSILEEISPEYSLGVLVCCSPWGCKESDTTERLNWTELRGKMFCMHYIFIHNTIVHMFWRLKLKKIKTHHTIFLTNHYTIFLSLYTAVERVGLEQRKMRVSHRRPGGL